MKKIIFLILSLTLFTGCFDYKEINTLNIVNSMGIDYKNENYIITINTLESENNQMKIKTYNESGKTISDALLKLDNKIKKELYLGHLEAIVIGNNSKDYLFTIMEYFKEQNEINKEFLVLITENGNAFDLIDEQFEINTLEESNFANESIFKNNSYNLNLSMQYYKLLGFIENKEDFYIPVLTKEENNGEFLYSSTQIRLYKNNEHLTTLSTYKTKLYALLNLNRIVFFGTNEEYNYKDIVLMLINKEENNNTFKATFMINEIKYGETVKKQIKNYLKDNYEKFDIDFIGGDI
ncbi:MAG: hypothetical protein ACK5HL_02045 [Bacilli bacterium]